jgi:hypothetical protein
MSLAADRDEPREGTRPSGWDAVTAFVDWDHPLPHGTLLRDYELRGVIGESPFAIVYAAWDHALRRNVAVKEYLPHELAGRPRGATTIEVKKGASADAFGLGLRAFIAEARMLARFDHPALLRIYRFWEEHGTAYRAMPLLEGPTLEQTLAGTRQEEAEVRAWLRPVLDALATMHAAKVWHHHVVPANVVLTATGPVLLDFAASRRVVASFAGGPGAAATAGYSAPEQYSDAATLAPGPWTDLYGLAAMAYHAVTGRPPAPADARTAHDRHVPLALAAKEPCSAGFVLAIDAGLALDPTQRPQDCAAFRSLMGGLEPPHATIPMGVRRDLMTEPFMADGDADREVTVPIPSQPQALPDDPDTDVMQAPFISIPSSIPPSVPASVPPVLAVSVASAATLEAAAPMPFERQEIGLNRNAVLAIGAGVLVLGTVAVWVLQGDGQGSTEGAGRARAGAPMGNAASTAVIPAVVVETPKPLSPPDRVGSIAPVAAPATTPPPTTPPATVTAPPAGATVPAATATTSPATATLSPSDGGREVHRIDVVTPPANAAERHARCADLLQEATLRELSAPESGFFRRECR